MGHTRKLNDHNDKHSNKKERLFLASHYLIFSSSTICFDDIS